MRFALLFLIACSSSSPPPTKPADTPKAQTGPEDSCKSNADCYCLNFNGAQFLAGRSSSRCCVTREICGDQRDVPLDHCMRCTYD